LRAADVSGSDTMLEKLMPKSDEFFDDFEKQATATVEGTRLLKDLFENYTDVQSKVQRIKAVEHEGDSHTHTAFDRLHKQFITPFDRAEIHRLLSRIDDVLDLADAVAERLQMYEIPSIPDDAKELASVLLLAAQKMQDTVKGLRFFKKPQQILTDAQEISRLENQADTLLRAALARLFKSGADPLTVIKWKEIYELLETATDRCEDVADVIRGVILEHS
jgi:predicted phosphate transport protein (TIGR00153 family)